MVLPRFIYVDETIPILELAIYPSGVDPTVEGWLPCKFPERPIDRGAAITHLIKGERCKACKIALEAFIMQNKRFVDDGTT